MDPTPERSRLRYVDAGDLDDATIDFDGLKVRNAAGEKLGDVDGVIVDVTSGRPHYVVVDSGGWFHSKLYLIPVGHVRLDHDNDALVADLTRERINRFPGFDRDQFARLSEDELDRMDSQMAAVCCPDERAVTTAGSERWTHHRTPDWWDSNYYRADRTRVSGVIPGSEYGHVQGQGATAAQSSTTRGADVTHAEAVVAREGGEVSPHLGGRAEPGDVIGVETGGERTYLGDTAEDENDRRRDAERAAGKQVEDDLKDRRKD